MNPIYSPFIRALAAWALVPIFFAVAIAPLIINGWHNITPAKLASQVPPLALTLCFLAYYSTRRP